MHFMYTLISCGTFPIITKLTKVTYSTAIIIDHITTNVTNYEILPGVIETSEVSDHYHDYGQVHNITFSRKNNNFIGYYRDKSKFDSDTFNYDLFSALGSYFCEFTQNN